MGSQYQQYLESDHWKQTRRRKRATAQTCGICGGRDVLDVHHLNYRHLLDVAQSDLRVLCRACHYLAHDLMARGVLTFTSTNHLHRWERLKAAVKTHFRDGHPRPDWTGVITQRWVLYFATSRGGWTREQMDALGVVWPPRKGWLHQRLGTPLSDARARQFEELSDESWRQAS